MRRIGKGYSYVLLLPLLCTSAVHAEQSQQQCARAVLASNAGADLAYRVGWKGLSLDSKRQVERLDDGSWRATNNSSLLFMGIEESSRFRLNAGRVESQTYDYQRKGMSDKHNLKLEFKPGQGYRATSPKGVSDITNATPLFDLLNHQMQLRIDLACAEPRDEYTYAVARRNRVSEYRYRRIGEERVQTPAGEFNAVRLERGELGDQFNQVWLAPELGYLIVKLVHQEEDDDKAELVLVKKPVDNG
ncbi:hypothetical protein GCM10011352_13220 [Marinobacterium zhoushanense]|uniref:DUF3108 domain-containing protein n=1 Tax=Marinobacterium zhoushanense TaxID=1679163 RepID=A0ABQ1K956_9GAMM|nr:DUF3108 domain-containing protein [Marinobacterium zhoushanense]GGB88565.1 hypothetical protein GCM10011352_13220 [Marinobacterium zhoushanense]